MSTVFVSTPNIVNEVNCPNNSKNVERSRVKVHVTVCVVKSCPRLRICPRKLKKSLTSFFLNFFSHLQKNSRCRAILYCRCGRAVRGGETFSLSPNCPRNAFQQIVGNVCVYDGCGFRSCVLSHVPKRNIKTKLQFNTSPAAGINTLLAVVNF